VTGNSEKRTDGIVLTFWCEELGVYALALDGDKRPCRVRTSNAGQVLFSGIAHPERAQRFLFHDGPASPGVVASSSVDVKTSEYH
jgi:hypothetical protein